MRQYEGAAFTETVEFSAEPEYGWKAHPRIIVRFDHSHAKAPTLKDISNICSSG